MTAWCTVPLFRLTLIILRRASSIAFCTATGTSFALPLPMPTRPLPSPTTVSAANARIRPPFTTLVTRLMAIIFSLRPSPRSSCCCCRCCIRAMSDPCRFVYAASELEAVLAGRVGQRLHATVIAEARAIERDRLDAERLRAFRNALADRHRRRLVAAVRNNLAHLGLERRSARQHLVARWRDDLRVDVAIRAAHDQARRTLLGDPQSRLARAADAGFYLVHR